MLSEAREAWSDAVDTAWSLNSGHLKPFSKVFQFPYAIKNWSKCVESSLSPPQATQNLEAGNLSQDAQRVEILLLAVAPTAIIKLKVFA